MAETGLQHGYLQIQVYADRYPDSELLATMSQSAADTGSAHFNGWWDQLREEHELGTLQPDAAVAAFYAVMHPVDTRVTPEETGPENARALVVGSKVLTIGGGRGELDYSRSGVLTADAIAVLGHPQSGDESYPSVRLGLDFADRKDTVAISPVQDIRIGDDEILEAYASHIIQDRPLQFVGRGNVVPIKALKATAILGKMGLLHVDRDIQTFAEDVVEYSMSHFSRGAQYPDLAGPLVGVTIAGLPYLHQLQQEAMESRIRDLARYDDFDRYQQDLVGAVAAVRSPFELDSLSPLEQELWRARAAAELLELRYSQLEGNA